MAVAVDPATLVLLTDAWLVGHLTDCNKQTNKFEKKKKSIDCRVDVGAGFCWRRPFCCDGGCGFLCDYGR